MTPMRTIWMALLLLAPLGACSKKPDTEHKPPPPDVPANFSGPLDARGGDPAWGLTVRGTTLVLTRPNQASMTLAAAAPSIDLHQAAWVSKMPDGQSMTATFYASPCTDPAGAVTYPFTAEIDLPGEAPLNGCGGPPARR
jgi:uncharacterized membrane protein